jgi:hypothetical protein
MSILSIGELLDLGNSAATAGLVPYSALEYNASGDISGISGSAIAGGVDTTIVSSIASSYVASGVSGKVDQSAFEDCCSAMSAVVSAKLDASASSQFYLTSNPSGFINSSYVDSSISGKQDKLEFGYSGTYISSINGSAIYDTQGGGGVDSATVSAIASSYAESATSGLQPSGNYYSASNPSGFISGITVDSSFTGNGKPGSALGLDKYDLALDQSLYSSLEGNTVTLGVQGGGVQGSYSGIEPIVVDNTANTIGANSLTFLLHSSLSGNLSGSEYTLSVNSAVYAPVQVVSSTALATGTGIVYVVTAS